jgi:hypothetical protein
LHKHIYLIMHRTERYPAAPRDSRGRAGGRHRVLIAAGVATAVAICCWLAGQRGHRVRAGAILAKEDASSPPPTSLNELLRLGTNRLSRYDIALMNLLCAEDLPGAESLNYKECLATLDEWASRVKSETERHFYRYQANPAEFENSEGYFRMLMMSVVLCEDFSIRYNPERMSAPTAGQGDDRFFADSRDIFLHGLLGSRRMGTCSSMPVLYAALGRRLGYPLKLATTKAHLFLRWEGPGERFNLEATGKGMNRYDDEHFKQWPFPMTEDEIKADGYLKSLTPVEELAVFLSLRGHGLREAGRIKEAASAYRAAAGLAPASRAYRLLLAETLGGSPVSFQPAAFGWIPSFASVLPPEALNSEAPPALGANPNPLIKTH